MVDGGEIISGLYNKIFDGKLLRVVYEKKEEINEERYKEKYK